MEFNVSIFVGGTLRGNKQVVTPCVIGRSKEADLVVAHPVMSRKHCELYEEAGALYLRDNSSLNGTIVKGEYIEKPIPLKIGDEFSVGELTFKIAPKAVPLTEEQYVLADRPTTPMSQDVGDGANAATIMETSASTGKSAITQITQYIDKNANAAKGSGENAAAEKVSTEQETPDSALPAAEPNVEEPDAKKPDAKKGVPKISPKDVRIVT